MIWVYLYRDGRLLLICPAEDANLWGLLQCDLWFRYELREEPTP